MLKIKCFFVSAFFILSFSIFANAQQVPNYLFLEVVDSKGNPVKDATLQIKRNAWENNQTKEIWDGATQTDEKGETRNFLPRDRAGIRESFFRVIKPNYFTFYDLGIKITNYRTNFKLELLKIPTTEEERKALGDEQVKREFMWAVKNGGVENVRKMLKSGINPNLNTNDLRGISEPKNIPAIIFAAANGDKEMIDVFLKAKVKLSQNAESIQNILFYYFSAKRFSEHHLKDEKTQREFEAGVKFLIDNNAEYKRLNLPINANALMLSAQKGNLNLVKYFLKKGLPINAQDYFGRTVLFYAPSGMFEFLLNSGADPNILQERDKPGCDSILMRYVWWGDIKTINTLLAHKADVNLTCPNGNNALKTAQQRTNYGYLNDTDKIINILKEAGAK
jgi:hypothetical protein